MQNQPYYRPLRENDFYADKRSARPIIAGTVARGHLDADTYFYTGKIGSNDGDYMPFPVTAEVMARGQQRFNIYCSPCHSELGDGNGMIVQRGFKHPPSYHIERLRKAPDRLFLRRDDQRLRRHARLRRAGSAGGPLGDRGLHSRAAVEPARHRGRCSCRRADRQHSRRRALSSCRPTTRKARPRPPPLRRRRSRLRPREAKQKP